MPHLRIRHARAPLQQLTKLSPLVGLLGHRQVGKTTLLQQFSTDYRSLDSLNVRKLIDQDPELYLSKLKAKSTVIDESQLCPELFPALKEVVRLNQRPGQFILSGSVRFTSRKAIRESLTGRIQYLELLPFTISEIEGDPLPTIINQLLNSKNIESLISNMILPTMKRKRMQAAIDLYLDRGGLPGVCFIRNPVMRKNKIEDQLRTILDLDLRTVHPTSLSYLELNAFVTLIAQKQGQAFHYQAFRRVSGLTPSTQQRLLFALESVFLIRRIQIEGSQGSFTYILEDQAESELLSNGSLDRSTKMIHLLYRNIRSEFFYRFDKNAHFFQYRTRSVHVPLAIKSGGSTLGFLPTEDTTPTRSEIATAHSFLKEYGDSKVILLHPSNQPDTVNQRILRLPYAALL